MIGNSYNEKKKQEEAPDFGKRGWDDSDDPPVSRGDGGATFRFRIPDPGKNPLRPGSPVTKRVLFLDREPVRLWEHDLYRVPGRGDYRTAVCLKENRIGDGACPLCDAEFWPKYAGFFAVIDLGFVEYLKGMNVLLHPARAGGKEYQFQRRILRALRGGRDKPGTLKTLQYQAEKRDNDFTGTVWDTTRTGPKDESVGKNWDYVERVAPEDFERYLRNLGAQGDLKLDPLALTEIEVLAYNVLHRMINGGLDSARAQTRGARYDDAPPPEEPPPRYHGDRDY